MNNFNFKEISVNLTPCRANFIGCHFNCKSIAINVPDEYATSNTKSYQFLISCTLYKNEQLIDKRVDILIETKKAHALDENLENIINDIESQQINLLDSGSSYTVEGNNYFIGKNISDNLLKTAMEYNREIIKKDIEHNKISNRDRNLITL